MARGGPRPNAGRKRTDPELKRLTGTWRADRDGPADLVPADVEAAVMVPPIHLGDLAQLIFRDLAGLLAAQGRAKPDYAQHVALLAMRLEQVQRFQAVLEVEGDTYTTQSGMIKARPQVAMLSDSMRQAQSLIAELMLNPSAAMRLATDRKQEADEFAGF